jgi:BlaI family penicillinase repressor
MDRELTKAEEQVMRIIWKLRKAFVKDIIEEIPGEKPAYNTVSTIVRILEKKGFVGHESFGKSHRYYPLVSRKEYTGEYLDSFVGRFFKSSYKEMVSFFADNDNLSLKEIEEIKKMLDEKLNQRK